MDAMQAIDQHQAGGVQEEEEEAGGVLLIALLQVSSEAERGASGREGTCYLASLSRTRFFGRSQSHGVASVDVKKLQDAG